MKRIILLLFALPFFLSCDKEEDDYRSRLTIASERVWVHIVNEEENIDYWLLQYLCKFDEDTNWRLRPDNIIGFDYVPGYEYKILIRKENTEFFLKKIVSKIKCDSEELPDNSVKE